MSRIGILTVGVLLTQSTASAAEPLELIPGDAAVVLRLASPKQTLDAWEKGAEKVHPVMAEQIRQNRQNIGALISNPQLNGVDQSRDWYVAVYPQREGQPGVLFVVPATDAGELTDTLPARFESTVKEDWVLYTDHGPTAQRVSGEVEDGVESTLSGAAADLFGGEQVAIFVNVTQLKEVYREELERIEQQADEAIESISNAAGQAQGVDMEAVAEMYGNMFDRVVQAVRDMESFVVGIRTGEAGLEIRERLTFTDGSKVQQFLARQSETDFPRLAALPDGALGYLGFGGDPKALAEWGMEMTKSMMKDEQQREKLDEVMELMADLEYGPMLFSFDLQTAGAGLLQYAALVEVEPTDKAKDLVRRMSKEAGSFEGEGFSQEIELAEAAEDYDGRKADVVTVRQEYDQDVDPTGMQQRMVETLFGPDGMVSRIVYLDDGYLQTMGGGRELMERALKQLDSPQSNRFETVRQPLSDEALFLVLFDVARLLERLGHIAAASPQIPLPVTTEDLNDLDVEPSYIGITGAVEEGSLLFTTHIPLDQMKSLTKIGEFVQQAMQRQQQQF